MSIVLEKGALDEETKKEGKSAVEDKRTVEQQIAIPEVNQYP